MRDAANNLRPLGQCDLIDQATLLDQVLFQLDEGKFQQLVDLLDSPPDENPGLARLMAVNAPWQAEKI